MGGGWLGEGRSRTSEAFRAGGAETRTRAAAHTAASRSARPPPSQPTLTISLSLQPSLVPAPLQPSHPPARSFPAPLPTQPPHLSLPPTSPPRDGRQPGRRPVAPPPDRARRHRQQQQQQQRRPVDGHALAHADALASATALHVARVGLLAVDLHRTRVRVVPGQVGHRRPRRPAVLPQRVGGLRDPGDRAGQARRRRPARGPGRRRAGRQNDRREATPVRREPELQGGSPSETTSPGRRALGKALRSPTPPHLG